MIYHPLHNELEEVLVRDDPLAIRHVVQLEVHVVALGDGKSCRQGHLSRRHIDELFKGSRS